MITFLTHDHRFERRLIMIKFLAQGVFLVGDDFGFVRLSFFLIQLNIVLLVFWHVVFVVDCLDGALGHARFAVDTLVWVNVEHFVITNLVETFNGANDDTVGVAATIARFSDNVRHAVFLSLFH